MLCINHLKTPSASFAKDPSSECRRQSTTAAAKKKKKKKNLTDQRDNYIYLLEKIHTCVRAYSLSFLREILIII